ncbi:MAG: histidine--tRNA ligase [Bacteroidia bacterium]|nr:histidine--tRNA ligase [Bacteroidia bacterium]MDW8056996.1 histidine--tRNA ligase [Bacteroidia bacterium]
MPKALKPEKIRPALPSGFRDFGPAEVRRRRYVFQTLSEIFERYGYEPLETPAVELLSVLLGKYGEEGDKLLFRILNSGDFLADVPEAAKESTATLLPYITEKALRYDLTVPMARWVAQNAGTLVFPFKRYQIQPVWRADRPQRGRFREFYQCDVDIVGAEGIVPLLEMIDIARAGLRALGIRGATFHLNHRSLLEYAAQEVRWPKNQFSTFCTRLDKTDKIGWQAVEALFREEGYNLPAWLNPADNFSSQLQAHLAAIPSLEKDLPVLRELISLSDETLSIQWDATLARGLEYYTGYVYEIRVPGSRVGSIAAGGAYASLVSDFGGPDLPAMGLSFGIERILTLLGDPSSGAGESPSAILVAWIDASPTYVQKVVQSLHKEGLRAFAYPAAKKLSKQIEYAQRRGFRWVVIVGAQEEQTEHVQLKDLYSHVQHTLPLHAVATACK